MTTTAIVGLGLVGGSLARALRRGRGDRIVAIDAAAVLASDAAQGTCDDRVDAASTSAVERALSAADRVVLATPVSVIADVVTSALDAARVVTDCGSTKRAVLAAARTSPRIARFVPGHPMAGLAGGGLDRASADLFVGRTWILCPHGADEDAVADVEALVRAVGARAVHMTAEAHDRAVALTSHVPQLLASALGALSRRRGASVAAGPAFERLVHGAGGPETMWRDIFATNADEVALVLRELAAELARVADGLETTPAGLEAALALLAEARDLR